jgi:hypothetical protein
MLHKARYCFGRWTCNHDSFSNTTKTRILDVCRQGERGRTRCCSSLAESSCLCATQRGSAGSVICHWLPGQMSWRVGRKRGCGHWWLLWAPAAGWVVNWWLGAIPRTNSAFGFLGCKRTARLEWMNGRVICDRHGVGRRGLLLPWLFLSVPLPCQKRAAR